MISSPASPKMVSLPPRPTRVSLPAPPCKMLAVPVPEIGGPCPLVGCGTRPAGGVLDRRQRVLGHNRRTAARGTRRQIDDKAVGLAVVGGRVVAGPTRQHVIACATGQHIVTGATRQ